VSQARIDLVRARLNEHGVDALIVNRYENRRWLTGVRAHDASPTATAGWVIVTPDAAVLVTSFLYYGAAVVEADGVEVVEVPQDKRLHEAVAEQLQRLGTRRVGFEEAWLTVQTHRELREKLAGAGELVPIHKPVVDDLRAVKDERELASIRRAVGLSDAAMEALFGELKPGMTEKEAAWFLETHMRQRGAEGMAFGPDVASGPNAAVPHHTPTDRAIQVGEPIWIDTGAVVDGYRSDITRTVLIGSPDEQYRRLWHGVLEAQKRVVEFLRPGRRGSEADALAREYLRSVGLGELFKHGLGHGVGLQIHELPRLSRFADEDAKLAAGMTVTVEPGAYVDGWGGVRHEELTVLTDEGVEVLTRAPKPFTL
jgi:Xaa-Pro aminopeptidase